MQYPGHVYVLAHSMGNIVAGEALRLAGTNQDGQHLRCEPGGGDRPHLRRQLAEIVCLVLNPAPVTPNIYKNWFASNNGGGAMHVINFYNINDYALESGRWELDQQLKPDNSLTVFGGIYLFAGYPYTGNANYTPGSVDDTPPWLYFGKDTMSGFVPFNMNVTADRYKVSAYAAQARASALGKTLGTLNNIFQNIALTRLLPSPIWPPDATGHSYSDHFWHSAEFRGDYWQQQGYWKELLGSEAFNLK